MLMDWGGPALPRWLVLQNPRDAEGSYISFVDLIYHQAANRMGRRIPFPCPGSVGDRE